MRALLPLLTALSLAACGVQGPNARVILGEDPAPKLSDYGFFADASAREPVDGVVPYDLVNPLFSDHAAKHRLVYVPEGQTIGYDAEGVFDFPVGSVLLKTFAFAPDMREPAKDERYIETRVLIRRAEGWIAYPYVWNAEQTEAVYAPVGAKQTIETITPDGEAVSIAYAVPNQNQCKTCHSLNGRIEPIGPRARHLNHDGPSGANQIADWTSRGILSGAPEPASAPADASTLDAAASLNDRGRAWLEINCAHCHRAGGSASNSGLFLDWHETNPTGWGVLKRPVAAGRGAGRNLFVIDPGSPDTSILVDRVVSTEAGVMMPELGRTLVDEHGLALMREWIGAMAPQ